jgi:hypothetical protein
MREKDSTTSPVRVWERVNGGQLRIMHAMQKSRRGQTFSTAALLHNVTYYAKLWRVVLVVG